MSEVVCVSESVYRGALTRGKRYSVLASDAERRQIRIESENGRTRWFPMSCFCQGGGSVPTLRGFELEHSFVPGTDGQVEAVVELSNGERRWCVFATPASLDDCGDWIEGTTIRFHYGNRHIIIASALTEDLIGRMLHFIDRQGHLAECTLALNGETPTV